MICPACGRALTEVDAGVVEVDACDGCGGLWLDHYELKRLDEQHEPVGAALSVRRDPSVQVDLDAPRTCPHCTDGAGLVRHFTSVERKVTVDECYACGGMWLDFGELAALRDEFPDEASRDAAADQLAATLVEEYGAAERAETMAELERAQRFAHHFRLLCPSYWIPGKQDGGAF